MGSGTKKKGQIDMGTYVYTEKEREAMVWCVKNGITIAPFAHNTSNWYLDITINGNRNRDPVMYDKKVLWKQMFKYYLYYYEKYKKD